MISTLIIIALLTLWLAVRYQQNVKEKENKWLGITLYLIILEISIWLIDLRVYIKILLYYRNRSVLDIL